MSTRAREGGIQVSGSDPTRIEGHTGNGDVGTVFGGDAHEQREVTKTHAVTRGGSGGRHGEPDYLSDPRGLSRRVSGFDAASSAETSSLMGALVVPVGGILSS